MRKLRHQAVKPHVAELGPGRHQECDWALGRVPHPHPYPFLPGRFLRASTGPGSLGVSAKTKGRRATRGRGRGGLRQPLMTCPSAAGQEAERPCPQELPFSLLGAWFPRNLQRPGWGCRCRAGLQTWLWASAAPTSTSDFPSSPSFRFVLCRPRGARDRPGRSSGTLSGKSKSHVTWLRLFSSLSQSFLFLTIEWAPGRGCCWNGSGEHGRSWERHLGPGGHSNPHEAVVIAKMCPYSSCPFEMPLKLYL